MRLSTSNRLQMKEVLKQSATGKELFVKEQRKIFKNAADSQILKAQEIVDRRLSLETNKKSRRKSFLLIVVANFQVCV